MGVVVGKLLCRVFGHRWREFEASRFVLMLGYGHTRTCQRCGKSELLRG